MDVSGLPSDSLLVFGRDEEGWTEGAPLNGWDYDGLGIVRTPDGAVSISVYDDQSGAEESNRAAAEWVRDNLSHLSVSPPQISAGEVVISI